MSSDTVLIESLVNGEVLARQRTTFRKILDYCIEKEGGQHSDSTPRDLHREIIYAAHHYKSALTDAINIFMNTGTFHSLFNDDFIKKSCDKLFPGADPDYLVISTRNFRVDLPKKFSSEEKKFSLGWHQESGYFENFVSHQNGWVIWLPLFACSREQGALLCLEGSSTLGNIQHEKIILDKVNNRNVRMLVPQKIIENYQQEPTCFEIHNDGDCAAFRFNTIHASGVNKDDEYVRITVQARISLTTSNDFRA
jgi:hypothetical protein